MKCTISLSVVYSERECRCPDNKWGEKTKFRMERERGLVSTSDSCFTSKREAEAEEAVEDGRKGNDEDKEDMMICGENKVIIVLGMV